jgi:peptide/nickel transport system ATP-binding protein
MSRHIENERSDRQPGSSAETLLAIHDLEVGFEVRRGFVGTALRRPVGHVRAVDGISLEVHAGELVALVGESGCGKTTTALATVGLVPATAGQILVEGSDSNSVSGRDVRALRRRVQMIFQDPYDSLDPRFRVRRTIAEPMAVHHIPGDRDTVIRAALERVGLEPADQFIDRFPHELSGGQRQRVAIAAALVLEPALLVADEPVSMLDTSVRAGVLEVLAELRGDGMGILMITHDLSTAARYADRICVMYLGRIVEEGPAREVAANPQHPYTKALVAAVPRSDGRPRDMSLMPDGETPDAASIPPGCRFHPRCPVRIDACDQIDPQLQEVGHAHHAACVLLDRPTATATGGHTAS